VETLPAPEESAKAAATTGGLITLEVADRQLQQVVDYLHTVSGKNIVILKEQAKKLLVSFKLENVTYRAILDFIARKYGLVVDDSHIKENLIFLDMPEKVSMVFNNADIRDVINTIAIQSGANIVIGPEVAGTISMRLENVPWKEALNIVVRTLNFVAVPEPEANNTIRITSSKNIDNDLQIRIFRLSYLRPEGSTYTAKLTSEFAEHKESKDTAAAGNSLIDVLTKVKSAQGSISFEKSTASLVVRDTETALDQMDAIIQRLDVPPKQIHVAVKLVELSDTDVENIGVNWNQGLNFTMSPLSSWATAFPFDISKGLGNSFLVGQTAVASLPVRGIDPATRNFVDGNDLGTISAAAKAGNSTALNTIGPSLGLGSMGFGNTTALFQMLRTKTNGRVIQAPQLIALDHEEATIQVGQLVRYAESFVATTEGGGQVSGFREASGSPIKLGMQLLIIPNVTGPENNILMTIIPKTEQFSSATGIGGAPAGFQRFIGPSGETLDLPETTQNIVVTKMMLRNGETGVIGGLRQDNEDYTETKVPGFCDIPFLGRLFKFRTRSTSGSNLLVFVTPTIIDFTGGADQFRKDLDKIRNEISTSPLPPIGDETEK
jgi:type IV pilus assembly protein PilQ